MEVRHGRISDIICPAISLRVRNGPKEEITFGTMANHGVSNTCNYPLLKNVDKTSSVIEKEKKKFNLMDVT